MKSYSMTALTLYPFLRQIKMRRSTAAAVTKGIDATGLPWLDQPKSTLALGILLRVMGAFSLRSNGVIWLSSRWWARQASTQPNRINNVKLTLQLGCQFSKTLQEIA